MQPSDRAPGSPAAGDGYSPVGWGPEPLAELRQRVLALAAAAGPATPADRVSRLVVIGSSSRGGSSVFAELLRACPALAHLPGEVNPAFRLAGLSYPGAGDSDALGAPMAAALQGRDIPQPSGGVAAAAGSGPGGVAGHEH